MPRAAAAVSFFSVRDYLPLQQGLRLPHKERKRVR